jgi:uncharacterized membrane protein
VSNDAQDTTGAGTPGAPPAGAQAAPGGQATPMRRSLKYLLIGSLALNLLLVGFLIGGAVAGARHGHGHFADRSHGGPPRPFVAAMGMGWALHGLPAERKEALRPTLQASFAQMRPHLRAMRGAQRDVAAALEREQFDRAELERALAAMQARMRVMERTGQAALVDMAAQLTWEERRQLAATLRAPPMPFRRGPREAPDAPGTE